MIKTNEITERLENKECLFFYFQDKKSEIDIWKREDGTIIMERIPMKAVDESFLYFCDETKKAGDVYEFIKKHGTKEMKLAGSFYR